MKVFSVITISLVVVFIGFNKINEIKNTMGCYGEICRLINFIKDEIRIKRTPLEELKLLFNSEKNKYIGWTEKGIFLKVFCPENAKRLFYDYCSSLGTTDVPGQISLCEEYGEKFKILRNEAENTVPSKIKTYVAFTALFCVCTLVFL